MPLYEYECDNCDETIEIIQKMEDEPLTECPVCEDGNVKKVFHANPTHYKCGGFYETDYKKKK